MADRYRVKAPVVKVSIGSLDGNRVARILHAGATVPDGVAVESLKALEKRGFIEKLDLPTVPEADSLEDERQTTEHDADGDPQGDEGEQPASVNPPPKAGAGASAEAWRNYAEAIEVEVAADASRDAVIAAVEAAGKPTE